MSGQPHICSPDIIFEEDVFGQLLRGCGMGIWERRILEPVSYSPSAIRSTASLTDLKRREKSGTKFRLPFLSTASSNIPTVKVSRLTAGTTPLRSFLSSTKYMSPASCRESVMLHRSLTGSP